MIEKNTFKKFLLCQIFLFSLFSAGLFYAQAQTGPNDDFDGDGIINSVDTDDDNDGILDASETSLTPVNTVNNPTFNSNTAGWTLNTEWTNYLGHLAGRNDNVTSSKNAYQNIVLKNQCTTQAVYRLKIRTDEYIDSGGSVNTRHLSFSAYLNATRLFTLENPASTANPTITRDAASNSIITGFLVNGNSVATSKSINAGQFYDVQITFNTALLPSSGTMIYKYTSDGDDVLIDDVYYYVNECTDTDNDGIANVFDLDSDGDGCPDAIEGSGNFSNTDLQDIQSVNATYTGGNSGTGYNGSSTSPVFDYLGNSSNTQGSPLVNGTAVQQEIGYSQNVTLNYCVDFDDDSVPDFEDIDDDNDGIVDALESPGCYYTPAQATSASTVKISTELPGSSITGGSAVAPGTDIPTMHNGVVLTQANSDHFMPAGSLSSTSSVIYQIEYPTAVGLSQMIVNTATINWGSGYFAVLEASPNGVTYEAVSAPVDVNTNTAPNTNSAKIWPVTLHTDKLYKFYRIRVSTKGPANSNEITNYEVTGVINMGTYVSSAHPKPNCTEDKDKDGLLNHMDLDSDGDGCPDAIEGGANFDDNDLVNSGISGGNSGTSYNGTSNNPVIRNLGNTVGNTATTIGVPTVAGTGQTANISNNPDYQSCTDFDGDAVVDFTDLDDDNDGILDTVESPGCFYTANVALFSITSGLTSPDDDQSDNDIQILHNGNTTTDTFNFNAGQSYNYATLFLITFQTAKTLNSITVHKSGNWPGSSGKIQGSVNGSTWVDLNNGFTGLTGTASSVTFTVTQNSGNYLYYRITGSGTETTVDALVTEVTVSPAGAYETKVLRIPGCINDSDKDGIDNQFDLDSDGDGCPDASEAGAASHAGVTSSGTATNGNGTDSSANYTAVLANAIVGDTAADPVAQYGNNGFYTGIESDDTQSATYTGNYTYNYAVNKDINTCSDTDNDGVLDFQDIDDDNDGVIDTEEMLLVCDMPLVAPDSTTPVGGYWSGINSSANGFGLSGTGLSATHELANEGNALYLSDGFYSRIVDYGFNTSVSLSNIILWLPESNDGTIGGDGPIKDFSVTVTYGGGLTYTSGTFTTVKPTGIGTPNYAQVFELGQRFDDVTNVRLNITDGWYDSDNVKNDDWTVASSESNLSERYNMTIGEIRVNCKLYEEEDTDNDGIPNHLDLDSDNDGCSDVAESGVSPLTDLSTPASATNNNGLSYGIAPNRLTGSQLDPNAVDDNNDGLNDSVDNDLDGMTNYTSTYTNATNSLIKNCFCYHPAVTSGTSLNTKAGITSLGRAASKDSSWPLVRKGGWVALEAKTKGFVPNRLTDAQISAIPAADLVEGMMIYNITLDCLQINTDGTQAGWKCFNVQACP